MLRTTDATSAIDLYRRHNKEDWGDGCERESEKEMHKRRVRNTMQKNRRQRKT